GTDGAAARSTAHARVRTEFQRRAGTAALARHQADAPSVQLAEALDDGEADAGALAGAGGAAAVAAFEQALGLLGADAGPGVLDDHRVRLYADAHLALAGVLAGIADQVADGNRQHRLRRVHQRLLLAFHHQFHRLAGHGDAVGLGHLLGDAARVGRAAPALVAREHEQGRGQV